MGVAMIANPIVKLVTKKLYVWGMGVAMILKNQNQNQKDSKEKKNTALQTTSNVCLVIWTLSAQRRAKTGIIAKCAAQMALQS